MTILATVFTMISTPAIVACVITLFFTLPLLPAALISVVAWCTWLKVISSIWGAMT